MSKFSSAALCLALTCLGCQSGASRCVCSSDCATAAQQPMPAGEPAPATAQADGERRYSYEPGERPSEQSSPRQARREQPASESPAWRADRKISGF